MIEKHFYADVDTPFHVWVRERSDAHGFRWVLRDASQLGDASAAPRPMHAASVRRRGGTTAGDCAD